MKKLLLALTFALALSSISHAQDQTPAPIPDAKRQEIEKMLKLTGTEKLMNQMLTQMIAAMKAQSPGVPDEFWAKFQQKMDMRELIDKLIPVYDKYYTIADLKAINAFYESPTGQKVLVSLPQIMQESMKIGQEWGAKVGAEAETEIKQENANK
jgi:uncharacterized protein